MATPIQKANIRPISFVFHNEAIGAAPVKFDLVIRPEDLTRTDPSRVSVYQTLGGAWVDAWGSGVPQVVISGTTGWGQGDRPNGIEQFQQLYDTVFRSWHDERQSAIENGFDHDLVRLIFQDELDGFTWVVAPKQFTLKRSKTRPLLMQYHIVLIWLDDAIATESPLDNLIGSLLGSKAAMDSFDAATKTIAGFIRDVKSTVGTVLGPLQSAASAFTSLTSSVLSGVRLAVNGVEGVVNAATAPIIDLASTLARASANIANAITKTISMPMRISARFQTVANAFYNIYCILKNGLRRRLYPDYSDLYGASLCSSTAGGMPLSPLRDTNPFDVIAGSSANPKPASVSAEALSALNQLATMDPVLNPVDLNQMSALMQTAVRGINIDWSMVHATDLGVAA